uniref:Uncharacterized protein n=1 Tax=Laticauda laticaudata TaxID=8630 RepID=A0A8C5RFK7_LATLA
MEIANFANKLSVCLSISICLSIDLSIDLNFGHFICTYLWPVMSVRHCLQKFAGFHLFGVIPLQSTPPPRCGMQLMLGGLRLGPKASLGLCVVNKILKGAGSPLLTKGDVSGGQ